jgi:hypothetical protein
MAGGYLTKDGFVLDTDSITEVQQLTEESVCGGAIRPNEPANSDVTPEPTQTEVTNG